MIIERELIEKSIAHNIKNSKIDQLDKLVFYLQQEIVTQEKMLVSTEYKLEQMQTELTKTQNNLQQTEEKLKETNELNRSLYFISILWMKLFIKKIIPRIFFKNALS